MAETQQSSVPQHLAFVVPSSGLSPEELQKKLIAESIQHRKGGHFLQNIFFIKSADGKPWKGSSVGCIVGAKTENYHAEAAAKAGLTVGICILMDTIFERLPFDRAIYVNERVFTAAVPDSNITAVHAEVSHRFLVDPNEGQRRLVEEDSDAYTVITDVADLYQRVINGETVTPEEWEDAADAACAVADAAAYAAAYAADAAHALADEANAASAAHAAAAAEKVEPSVIAERLLRFLEEALQNAPMPEKKAA